MNVGSQLDGGGATSWNQGRVQPRYYRLAKFGGDEGFVTFNTMLAALYENFKDVMGLGGCWNSGGHGVARVLCECHGVAYDM